MTEIATSQQIEVVFKGFQRAKVSLEIPAIGALSSYLMKEVPRAQRENRQSFAADPRSARLFVSAAIEMWHRALHSFIVSAGLTKTSHIWAVVSGYYASHYVIRSYAHLLGRYVLYRTRAVISLGISGGTFYCMVDRKSGVDREHKVYRKLVHESVLFGSDPFLNVDDETLSRSDAGHRVKANYYDHVGGYDEFRALTLADIADRINRISEIEINAVPVPNADAFPDVEAVQIVAYHRIVRFRQYLDSLLGADNKFWNAHRTPHWCRSLVDFQIVNAQLGPQAASV